MIRFYLSFLLICVARFSFGQATGAATSIQVPDGNKVILHTYAKGVQVYICTQDPKDTSNYTWVLKEPVADLYADSAYKNPVGKHYFSGGKNPTWDNTDGSKVIGIKMAQVNSPDGNGIPWLLLRAAFPTGKGVFSPVTFVQRVNTKGGKAPIVANKDLKGQLAKIPYTAEYLFYGKN